MLFEVKYDILHVFITGFQTFFSLSLCVFFFFQAEDGIRDVAVTGVQTCALPICDGADRARGDPHGDETLAPGLEPRFEPAAHRRQRTGAVSELLHAVRRGARAEIGRASCRERV